MREKLSADGKMLDVALDQRLAKQAEEFAAYVRAETEKWGKIVRTAGIKLESY